MTLPVELATRQVTLNYLDLLGTDVTGSVTFSLQNPIVMASGQTILPRPIVVQLVNSAVTVALPVNDDPDTMTKQFTYQIEERIFKGDGALWTRGTWSFNLPTGTSTLNLGLLAPAAPSAGVITVKGPQGDPGVAGPVGPAGAAPLPLIAPATKTLWQDSTWRENFQSGHVWFTGGGGTLTSDVNSTAQFIKGTQAVRVTTAGTGVQSHVRTTGMAPLDLTGKAIRVTLRVEDVTKLDYISFYVGSSVFANNYSWVVTGHSTVDPNYIESGEWVTFTLHWSDVQAVAGTYTLTNGVPSTKTGFTDFQLALYDVNGAGGLTYHLQSVELIPDATTIFPHGVISVTFDDSYASVYNLARPLFDANGQRATTYNIADVIDSGDPAYMTMAQLKATQNVSGWEAAGHAYRLASHNLPSGLRSLTEAACDEEFQRLKLWMMRNGLKSDNFAYPQGHFGFTTDGKRVDEIAARYWATSRTIISEQVENLHPAMPQRVHSRIGMSTTAQVNAFLAVGGTLDKLYSQGGWYILCLHRVVAGVAAGSLEINVTDLSTLLNGIAAKGVPVRPVSEIVRYYQTTGVTL